MTKVNQIEYKILQMLKEDSRKSASKIAKELGLSRATVAKIIKSLKDKGVKFTVEYHEKGELFAFVISDKCLAEECYKLIDGKIMNIIRGDLSTISQKLSELGSDKYFISMEKLNEVSIERAELYCDYCGNEIKGNPYLVKLGKKVYYTCCKTCQTQLKKKLEHGNDGGKL
ncbi:TRASH domain-containing protein [Sulfurisphaera ohwakuensis]|uniref:Biotin operon repressor n=1 Tax=Sulfurisphaera ohwakuensis TaxID=69656 RepID=A0A650CHY8_SULOH|nr:TRASH domain-containing protein [Sulfurisphaera ohwakuensis]MBB5253548.1 biotin operon repressor [Sulfurisphaera ohwakuensis]QGR17430.1 TRASH domain-containing protein [Sulfurisphaera ohwakuensis]